MRLIYFLITIFILLSESVFGQYDINYYDDFSNNKHSWSIGNDDDLRTEIKNGVFEIEHKRDISSYNIWQEFNIEQDQDFYIETKLKQISGVDDWGFGLVWGARAWSNSHYFLLASNGMFTVAGYKNKNWNTLKDWTDETSINPIGKYNILAVKKVKD